MWVGSFNMHYTDEQYKYEVLDKYIPKGYDIYVLGVQECISDKLFEAMSMLFNKRNQQQTRMPTNAKIEGRGDGAILGTKYTGLCIYVRSDLKANEQIQYIKSGVVAYNQMGCKVFLPSIPFLLSLFYLGWCSLQSLNLRNVFPLLVLSFPSKSS